MKRIVLRIVFSIFFIWLSLSWFNMVCLIGSSTYNEEVSDYTYLTHYGMGRVHYSKMGRMEYVNFLRPLISHERYTFVEGKLTNFSSGKFFNYEYVSDEEILQRRFPEATILLQNTKKHFKK